MLKEFKEFAMRGNVLDMAVGIIIGAAFGRIITSLVNDIIMPIPGALISGGDWRNAILTIPVGNGISLAIGDFVGVVVDFVIVASVVFIMVKYAKRVGIK